MNSYVAPGLGRRMLSWFHERKGCLQHLLDGSPHLVEADGKDTLRLIETVAPIARAGVAVVGVLHDLRRPARVLARPRPPDLGTGRSENHHRRPAQRGGHVSRTAIVADKQTRTRQRGGELA